MTERRKVLYLLMAYAAMLALPYVGGLIAEGGAFPPGYFNYPPTEALPKDHYNQVVFILVAICFVAVVLLYLFPRLFGFRKVEIPLSPKPVKKKLPPWFWIGLVIWGVTLFVMWGKFSEPKWLLNWAILPLLWGFTLMLDGWLYRRTGGRTPLFDSSKEIIGIGVAAMGGWMLFEYLNYFVDDNWVYPMAHLIPGEEFLLYAIVGSSGLMPPIFLLYSLMQTFPRFKHRFDSGLKFVMPGWMKNALLLISLLSMFIIPFYPDKLFGILWISPLLLISVVLDKIGLWTPFKPVGRGNWSPVLKFGLTYIIYGFLLEFWNFFSATHDGSAVGICFSPAHWTYSIPYVNVYHVWEMPLLGYLGYAPFGIYTAVWWISFAFLLNIPSGFPELEEHDK